MREKDESHYSGTPLFGHHNLRPLEVEERVKIERETTPLPPAPRRPAHCSPAGSRWFPGCTWIQRTLSQGRNTDPRLLRTLDPETWRSCSTSPQLEGNSWAWLVSWLNGSLHGDKKGLRLNSTWYYSVSCNSTHGYGSQHGLVERQTNKRDM